MTEDNAIGLVNGLVSTVVFSIAVFHVPRLTGWATILLGRTLGRFWANRVNEGFVRLMIILALATGVAFIVISLVGGFDAGPAVQ